jgi:hypothetical protein
MIKDQLSIIKDLGKNDENSQYKFEKFRNRSQYLLRF